MNKLRFHILQHAPFESPGYLNEWIEKNNYLVSYSKLYKDNSLPEHYTYDVLVIMGGPMGVYDVCENPWLAYEKIFIREAINLGRKVIGICLGSQLIASALGAKVFPNKEKEIGFFPILINKTVDIFSFLPDEINVFHWHGDTFELPVGAVLIASSEATQNQAFIYESNVLALQFHMEVTETLLQQFFENDDSELKPAKFVQTKEEILKGSAYIPTSNLLFEEILNSFVNNQL